MKRPVIFLLKNNSLKFKIQNFFYGILYKLKLVELYYLEKVSVDVKTRSLKQGWTITEAAPEIYISADVEDELNDRI